jgi:short-subunit dehydrogenase
VIAPEHALVTGASGAIGAAIARTLRAAWPSVRLALVDRELAPMQALAGELGNATVHVVDLTDLAALPRLVAEVEQVKLAVARAVGVATIPIAADTLPVDVLVNCAGIMHCRTLTGWRWEEAQRLVEVDLLAPLRLVDLVVRGMIERRRGTIVNVSSMAGRVPVPGGTYYCASKAGLAMASEIAREELAPQGIRVVTVYPGPIASALEQGARDDYGGAGLAGRLAPTGDARVLARKIVAAVQRDEPRVIYPRIYNAGWYAPNACARIALGYGPTPIR